MRSVAMLFWQSFTGTRLSRLLSGAGLVLLCVGCGTQLIVPSWTLGTGMNPGVAIWVQTLVLGAPWLALLALFLATSAQPRIIHGLVFGHAASTLPNVRRAALLGAIAVALAVALAAAVPAALFFIDYPVPIDLRAVFRRSFAIAFINFGLLYLAFWALACIRGIWFFVGPALILVAITVPAEFLNDRGPPLGWREVAGSTGWIAYAVLILAGDRIARRAARWRRGTGRRKARSAAPAASEPRAAVTLLLGADRPWIGAIAQAVPVAVALLLVPERGFALFGLVLFGLVVLCAVNSAQSVLAAPRSRALWLRTDASTAELFRRAERAFWAQSAWSLGTAVLILAGLVAANGYPAPLFLIGVALLALATAAGLYLGLSMTRGLPPIDASLAAAIMGLVVAATVIAVRHADFTPRLLACGAALLAAIAGLRLLARARWTALDWMRCRPPERA